MLNKHLLDIDYIVSELYDPSKRGGICIQGLIEEDARKRILTELKANESAFKRASSDYHGVAQDLSICFAGEGDKERPDTHFGQTEKRFARIHALRDEYQEIYQQIAEKAGFTTAHGLNSVSLHHFLPGSIGIGPHRDVKRFKRIIITNIIEGEAPFYLCSDKQGADKSVLETFPGSVVFLRAQIDERDNRPYHGIGLVTKERYTAGFREYDSS